MFIKKRQADLEEKLSELNTEDFRLSQIRKRIIEGKITARGFQEAVGIRGFQGLEISENDKSFLDQLLILEDELAAARTKFRPDSKIIINLLVS